MPTCSTPLLQPPPTTNYSPPHHQTRCDTPFPPAAAENNKNPSSATAAAADKEVEILMMKSIKQHENIQDATLFLPIPKNLNHDDTVDNEEDSDNDHGDVKQDVVVKQDGVDGGGNIFALRKAAGILDAAFSSDHSSGDQYFPYVSPSIVRNKRSSKLDDERRQKFSSDDGSRELLDHIAKRMSNNYRDSMEDLRYSFHKSLAPIKARVIMMLKLLIYMIITIKVLVVVVTALLVAACVVTKMMSKYDDDDNGQHHHHNHGGAYGTTTTTNSSSNDNMVVRGNVSCIYVTNVLPNCDKIWKAMPPKKKNNKTAELRDMWKMHLCNWPCLNCDRLMRACVLYNAKGACHLWNTRCKENAKKPGLNICVPGCLDCQSMRDGCDYCGDYEQCAIFNEYCKVNIPQSTQPSIPTTSSTTTTSSSTATVAETTTTPTAVGFEGFVPRNKTLCRILYKNCTTTNYVIPCLDWHYYCTPPIVATSAPKPEGGIFEKVKTCGELHNDCINKLPLSYYDCLQWYYFCLKRAPTTTTTSTTSTTTTTTKEEEKEDGKQQRFKK